MTEDTTAGDTFGVGVRLTDTELRLVVRVPSEIDSGWNDPETFQRRIESYTWQQLDRETTLSAVAETAESGQTLTLGTVTMRPDGDVVADSLSVPTDPT